MQQKQGRDVLGKKDEVEVEQGQLEEEEQDVAEVDEFKDKQREVEAVCNPIISKLYGAGGMPGGMGGAPPTGGQGGAGPTIEEVD